MTAVDNATESDIEALVALESALFAEDSGVHDPFADISWPERKGREDFLQLLASDRCVLLVARSGSEAVGFLAGYETDSSPTRQPVKYAVLRSLYVSETARRDGVARQLTARFVEWARDCGCVEAHVDHYTANVGAAALYEELGFGSRSISRALTL